VKPFDRPGSVDRSSRRRRKDGVLDQRRIRVPLDKATDQTLSEEQRAAQVAPTRIRPERHAGMG
jgi:hypothetical protein